MKTTIINNADKRYLEVEIVPFVQKGNSFYVGKVKASTFLDLYTVSPARYDIQKYSALANSFPDDKEYYNYLINEDIKDIKSKDFQREANSERVNKIATFISKNDYPLFPNTIIANCELINDLDEYKITENSTLDDFYSVADKPDFLSFYRKDDNREYLIIPYIKNSILVIDGQHRLKGLEEVIASIKEDYDLIISFLIGFDRAVIARQFYTINFEQKPVNKSLLLELTGEFSIGINEVSLMHNVVKLLNEIEESPFHGRVKMLGVTPKNATSDQKVLLSISQAFLIDSMIRFISVKAKNTLYPPIFLKYFQNPEEHIYIIRSISRFFSAVKLIKPDWEDPKNSILSKGMGVGALLKVFNLLFPIIYVSELESVWGRITELTVNFYVHILQGLENVDFSTDGEFGKTGSAGSINRIKEKIITNLTYLGSPATYSEFEVEYKQIYLPNFNRDLDDVEIKIKPIDL